MTHADTSLQFSEPFCAPWWMPGGHLQTVWRKLHATPQLIRHRRRIELRDGDFIDVDFESSASATADSSKPLVVPARLTYCPCSTNCPGRDLKVQR
jgi:predicted alpha/beta-fold hydrolase